MSPASASQAGVMNCPACGHRQQVSNQCESCGIVFSEYRRNPTVTTPARKVGTAPAAAATPSPVQAGGTASPSPLRDDWRDNWMDSEDNEPGEEHYLALFFGPPIDLYLTKCERYLSGPRTRFGLSWNWAAFFSPFIWSLYRKMWGWSLVIFVTEVIVPMLLIVMGTYEIISSQLVYLGYAVVVLNRLFWPLLANFLYCSHARGTLRRLHMMAPNYAAEIDIATAGGVSVGAVLAGLAVAAVMSLFLWSVVDSVSEPEQVVFLPEQFERPRSVEQNEVERPSVVGDLTGLSGLGKSTENKWIATRRLLHAIGEQVNTWLAKGQGREVAQLTLLKLRQETGLTGQQLKDAWGADIQFIPNNKGYRLISSGPDRLFGTADDIQYQQVR